MKMKQVDICCNVYASREAVCEDEAIDELRMYCRCGIQRDEMLSDCLDEREEYNKGEKRT